MPQARSTGQNQWQAASGSYNAHTTHPQTGLSNVRPEARTSSSVFRRFRGRSNPLLERSTGSGVVLTGRETPGERRNVIIEASETGRRERFRSLLEIANFSQVKMRPRTRFGPCLNPFDSDHGFLFWRFLLKQSSVYVPGCRAHITYATCERNVDRAAVPKMRKSFIRTPSSRSPTHLCVRGVYPGVELRSREPPPLCEYD